MTPGDKFIEFVLNSDTKECLIYPGHPKEKYWIFRGEIVHRKICTLKHGPPSETKNYSCHSCNVKGCINWKHLRWGSHQENVDDYSKSIGRSTYRPDRNSVEWFNIVVPKRAD